MAFVVIKRLKWGAGYLLPGDPVPEGEKGRNYGRMVTLGQIAQVYAKPKAKPAAAKAIAPTPAPPAPPVPQAAA